MKGIKSFSTKAAIATATSVAVAGAGSAVVDWALKKYDVIPAEWGDTVVQAGKIVIGAVGGSMIKNQIAKSVFDGIATVAAANLTGSFLLTDTPVVEGLPKGTIGRINRLGQRGFRRGGLSRKVSGVGNAASSFMAN